jgi:hypothetical protein
MTAKTLGELAPTLKVGQELMVTHRVKVAAVDQSRVHGSHVLVRFGLGMDTSTTWIPNEAHAELLPDPIKVGDRVRSKVASRSDEELVVLAIDGDEAWLKTQHGDRGTEALYDLERIP